MRIVKKTATIVLYAVVAAVVLVGVASFIGGSEPTGPGGWVLGFRPLVVVGSSMEPAIHVGSLLVVARADPASIVPGDIITFAEGDPIDGTAAADGVTTHRVVGVGAVNGATTFRTRGDANSADDEGSVPASALLGRAVFAVPYVGYIRGIVSTKVALLAVIALCVCVAVNEVVTLVRATRVRSEERARNAG